MASKFISLLSSKHCHGNHFDERYAVRHAIEISFPSVCPTSPLFLPSAIFHLDDLGGK